MFEKLLIVENGKWTKMENELKSKVKIKVTENNQIWQLEKMLNYLHDVSSIGLYSFTPVVPMSQTIKRFQLVKCKELMI